MDQERTIERRVHEALRGLPPARAPRTLEARVLDAIEGRAAAPWWRSSFAQWPWAARAGFLGASLALVLAAILIGQAPAVGGSFAAFQAHPLMVVPGVSQAQALLATFAVLRTALARAIPTGWIYFAFLLGGLLYALLFGLGTAAYRALYLGTPAQVSYR